MVEETAALLCPHRGEAWAEAIAAPQWNGAPRGGTILCHHAVPENCDVTAMTHRTGGGPAGCTSLPPPPPHIGGGGWCRPRQPPEGGKTVHLGLCTGMKGYPTSSWGHPSHLTSMVVTQVAQGTCFVMVASSLSKRYSPCWSLGPLPQVLQTLIHLHVFPSCARDFSRAENTNSRRKKLLHPSSASAGLSFLPFPLMSRFETALPVNIK